MSLKEKIDEILEESGYAPIPGYAVEEVDGVEIIQDEIVEQSRWSTYHQAIVRYEGKLYGLDYDVGSTEMQDSSGEYELYEVEPVEVTTVKYVKKK